MGTILEEFGVTGGFLGFLGRGRAVLGFGSMWGELSVKLGSLALVLDGMLLF